MRLNSLISVLFGNKWVEILWPVCMHVTNWGKTDKMCTKKSCFIIRMETHHTTFTVKK